MCLTIPSRVISIKDKEIIINELGKEKKASGSLIQAKVGDYVILENNLITRRINKKSAKEVISLLRNGGTKK